MKTKVTIIVFVITTLLSLHYFTKKNEPIKNFEPSRTIQNSSKEVLSTDSFVSQINEPWIDFMYTKDIYFDFRSKNSFSFVELNDLDKKEVHFISLVGDTELNSFLTNSNQFKNLEGIKLKNANINSLTFQKLIDSLSKHPHLKKIHLFHCNIRKIPNSIERLKGIEVLDLSLNKITKLPSEIGNLSNLRWIRLYNNRNLKSLPKEVSHWTNLEHLDIAGTKISEIPESIGNWKKLSHITANACSITQIPIEIQYCKHLKYINLGANRITKIPIEFCSLVQLKFLDLGNNRISKIPEEFSNLSKLTTCMLNDNRLTEFPKQVLNFKHIVNLWIHNNQISRIPKEVANLKYLALLIAENNTDLLKSDLELIKTLNPKIHISTHY